MTSTASMTTKRPSEALLEHEAYETTPIDRLREERVTINNRLSGTATQLKRAIAAGDHERETKLRDRQLELQARRQLITDQLGSRSDDLVEATAAGATTAGKVDVPQLNAEAPIGKRERRKAAKAALDASGVTDITEQAFALLEELHGYPAGITVTALAANTGQRKPGATRDMQHLVKLGLATRIKTTGIYRPVAAEAVKA